MKIPSLDTSATVASVALGDDGKLLAEYTLNNKNTHSESLLPMVEEILSRFSLHPSDIGLFCVSNGPGSFTGVRIGVATVKGLAFGTSRPCAAVSTLEALAYNLISYEGLICPVMNARRDQVYTALFRSDGQHLVRILPDSALSLMELDALLAEKNERIMLCGDGTQMALDGLKYTNIKPTPERLIHQSAHSVMSVGYRMYIDGKTVSDKELDVLYLRASQAERELMEKNKKDNK